MSFENTKGFLFAYIFGKISPINNIIIPIIPTSIIVSIRGLFIELNNGLSIEANSITIVIFIKLFEIKIVARSLLGFSKRVSIFLINLLEFCSLRLNLSREKKATSHPEVKADRTKKTIISVSFTITSK